MSTMTLEIVRDALKGVWVPTHWGTDGKSYKMSDLIESLDAHLTAQQAAEPVEQPMGESYPAVFSGSLLGRRVGLHGSIESIEALEAYIDAAAKLYAEKPRGEPVGHFIEVLPGEWGQVSPQYIGDEDVIPLYRAHPKPEQAAGDGVVSAARDLLFWMEISGVKWRDNDPDITKSFDALAALLKEQGNA